MKRKHRWERKRNVRPAVRAQRHRQVSQDQVMRAFEVGLDIGRAEERKYRDWLHRLAEAAENGTVADLHAELEGEHLVDEIENWLDDQ